MYHQPIKKMRAALAEKEPLKRPDYVGLGEMLADAREVYGISLRQASKDLHIKLHYLAAIESGRLSEIPGMAYAKGYMRRYASYLGVSIDTVLEMPDPEAEAPPVASVSAARQEPVRMRAAVLVSLAVILVLLALWGVMGGDSDDTATGVRTVPDKWSHLLGVPLSSACLADEALAYPPCYWDNNGRALRSVLELHKPLPVTGLST